MKIKLSSYYRPFRSQELFMMLYNEFNIYLSFKEVPQAATFPVLIVSVITDTK